MAALPVANANPQPNSIWRETFRIYRGSLNDRMQIALVFFIIFSIIIYFICGKLIGFFHDMPKTLHGKTDMPANFPFIVIPAYFLLLIAGGVQWFHYIIYFSRREMKVGQPVLSVGRFFYCLGLKLLTFLICLTIGGIGSMAAFAFYHLGSAGTIIGVLCRIAAHLAYYYLIIKFTLIGTLAANRITPVIDNSWKLTDGNWWRLFGNMLLVYLIVDLCFLPIGIVLGIVFVMLPHSPNSPMVAQLFAAIALALLGVISTGIIAASGCAATRILVDEKRQSDPSFLSTAIRQ